MCAHEDDCHQDGMKLHPGISPGFPCPAPFDWDTSVSPPVHLQRSHCSHPGLCTRPPFLRSSLLHPFPGDGGTGGQKHEESMDPLRTRSSLPALVLGPPPRASKMVACLSARTARFGILVFLGGLPPPALLAQDSGLWGIASPGLAVPVLSAWHLRLLSLCLTPVTSSPVPMPTGGATPCESISHQVAFQQGF